MPIIIFILSLIIPDNSQTFSKIDIILERHNEVIMEVMKGESQFKENARNENDGGSLSLGCLQFKEKTFFEKANKFQLFTGLDHADWQNRWADCWSQKLVMAYMLEYEEKPLCHWQNTSCNVRNYLCGKEKTICNK